jgi:hypothetical protein
MVWAAVDLTAGARVAQGRCKRGGWSLRPSKADSSDQGWDEDFQKDSMRRGLCAAAVGWRIGQHGLQGGGGLVWCCGIMRFVSSGVMVPCVEVWAESIDGRLKARARRRMTRRATEKAPSQQEMLGAVLVHLKRSVLMIDKRRSKVPHHGLSTPHQRSLGLRGLSVCLLHGLARPRHIRCGLT